MPAKKGKKGGKGKGKGKKKKAAKLKAAVEKEEVKGKTKLFFRVYPTYCAAAGSIPAPRVVSACKECIEEDIPLNKVKKVEFSANSHLLVSSCDFPQFVLETAPDFVPPKSAGGKGQKKPVKSPSARAATSSSGGSQPVSAAAGAAPPPPADKPPLPILLQPLFKSLTEAGYNYMRCLLVWSIPVSDEGAVSLVSRFFTPFDTSKCEGHVYFHLYFGSSIYCSV